MNPNKFFSELKRRNIYKVALTYAIVAWLLAQMAGLAADSFYAPEWVMKMIIVVLIIGFPIAIIFAWAFEMSPQGMIRATSEASRENLYSKKKKKPLNSNLFIGVLALIIIGQFAYNKYSNDASVDSEKVQKSIAVLPFINDSSNEDNLYFCNGIMEGILDHLSKIPELKVVSRTSVEQYRENKPSLKKIAEELGVQYLVEGSVQRIEDQVVIFAQLIYAEDDEHLWSQRYDEDVTELFAVQADVTESIAEKLEMIISPMLKERIENVPTRNTLAYDFYLRGNEYRYKANIRIQENDTWAQLLDKAQLSYELALEKDSLFAEAYVGKAFVELERNKNLKLGEKNYLALVFLNANKAININPDLYMGYYARGLYYLYTDNIEFAKKDYEKLLELAPNIKYELELQLYGYLTQYLDFIQSIKIIKEMEKNARSDDDFLNLYNNYASLYRKLDDPDMEAYYYNKLTKLTDKPNMSIWWLYFRTQKFEKAISYVLENYPKNNQTRNILIANTYENKGESNKAFEYYKKWYDQVEEEGINNDLSNRDFHRYGQILILYGKKEKGMKLIQKQVKINEKLIQLGQGDVGLIYDLVGIYSFLGQNEKAYFWMEKFDQDNGWLKFAGLNSFVQFDTQFDNIRSEKQFKNWVSRGEKQLEKIRKEVRDYLSSEEALN